VRFWDTSAIIPLCVNEPNSATVKAALNRDPSMVVWWATRTECASALARQAREGSLTAAGERQARQVLQTLIDSWIEIQPTDVVRESAERSLAIHALRAADALQLAAALQWCQRQTRDAVLVSLDGRLRDAAHREGFTVLPPGAR